MEILYFPILIVYAFFIYTVTNPFYEVCWFLFIYTATTFIITYLIKKLFHLKRGITIIVGVFVLFANFFNFERYEKYAEKLKFVTEYNRGIDKKIINIFKEKYPDDEFYFLSRMRTGEKFDDYWGLLYSKKLKEIKYTKALPVYYNSYTNIDDYYINNYKESFDDKIRNDFLLKDIKKIFGNKIKFDFRMGYEKYSLDEQLDIMKTKNSNIKLEAWDITLWIFMDTNLKEEDYDKKLKQYKDFLKDHNISTINFFVHFINDDFFSDYDKVKSNIFPAFIKDEDISKILEKIKNKEQISEDDKLKLIDVYGQLE